MSQLVGGLYELEELLSEGGMGLVHRGVHHLTRQEVAIKVLPPELSSNPELRARFLREAQVLARLEHPNIVSLLNFLEDGDRFYLVMQLIRGKTISDAFDWSEPIPVDDVLHVANGVLAALTHAHKQDVVHRDIKPDNILLRDEGGIMVADFGVAKLAGVSRMTSTGMAVGTVWYMSPEQIMGQAVDARSDLYSLGVTLYEMLKGSLPFPSESDYEVRKGHVEEPPPPLSAEAAPPWLSDIVHKALSKDPSKRFQDAQAFLAAIKARRTVEQQSPLNGPRASIKSIPAREPRGVARAPVAHVPTRRSVKQSPLVIALATLGFLAMLLMVLGLFFPAFR